MLAIRLFGGFSVERDGQAVELASRPAQALLAYLALHPDQAHRRERLAGVIWPDAAEDAGRNNLRHALWKIRGALGDGAGCIDADRVAIALRPGAVIAIDVGAIEHAASSRATVDELAAAVGGCRGELLAGFYDEWIGAERERVAAAVDRAARALCDGLIAAARWRDVVLWAERWLAVAPVAEAAFRALMRGHAELGDQAAVEATYRRAITSLDDQLEADVSAATRALYDQLTAQPAPAAIATASASASVPRLPRYRLPAELTSFVARDRELAAIAALFAQADVRLITIVGPGGAGKTRLALRAATAAAPRFTDGACLIALEAVDTADQLPVAIADALGVALGGRGSVTDQLHAALRDRSVLLVLDNFEQLVDAAAAVSALLAAAPGLTALVTSRERLAVRAEHLVEVSGVEPPAGLELFCARARQLAAAFAPTTADRAAIAQICTALDEMPLAIELAAALAPAEGCAAVARAIDAGAGDLATTLRDVPARHRSLRAVFAHSRGGLSADDDRALAAVAVFRGGFTPEAAAAIAGASPAALARLVDTSLVFRADDRLRLHETVRQLAGERMPAALADRHAGWFCAQLADAARTLVGRDQVAAMAALGAELDNVRAAWRHAIGRGDTAALTAATDGLATLLDRRSAFVDGEHLFRLAADAITAPPALHARLAARRAAFLYQLGELAAARELATTSLATARADDDLRDQAFALHVLGRVAFRTSELAAADTALREAAELARSAGDAAATGAALSALGMVATSRGEYAAARALQLEAIAALEAIGDASGAARAENHLGIVEGAEGHYDRAEELLRHSLATWRAIGNHASAATALNNLGVVLERKGDLDAARECQDHGLAVRRDIGDLFGVSYSLSNLGIIARKQGRLADARRDLAECLELRRRLGDRAGAASALVNLGRVHADLGDDAAAVACWRDALDAALAARARPRAAEILIELGALIARTGAAADAATVLGFAAAAPAVEQVERERARTAIAALPAPADTGIAAVAAALRRAIGLTDDVAVRLIEVLG